MSQTRNRRRVFYESIKSGGTFPDGRIKLDVLFRSEDGSELVWTPPWRAVIDLSASAKYLEETNKTRSAWTPELEKSFKDLEQVFRLSERIMECANVISATLHPLTGDSAPRSLFPSIPLELKRKGDQIFFILSNAKDMDDFITKLSPLIAVHRKYFNEPFKQNFNLILKKLGLKLDDHLNIVKLNT